MKTNILKNGRVTEKASSAMERNVYVFDISVSANKTEVKKAVFALYKVHPLRVNILAVPKKNIMFRGKVGTKSEGKKAFVYLKEGDKIEFV